MKPTKAQIDFIKEIEEFINEKFTGETKKEAAEYIQCNIETYKLQSQSRWVIENGYD